jgi:hypothetical protein
MMIAKWKGRWIKRITRCRSSYVFRFLFQTWVPFAHCNWNFFLDILSYAWEGIALLKTRSNYNHRLCLNFAKGYFKYFMFGKYNGFVSKARVSACMYFLVYIMKRREPSILSWGMPQVIFFVFECSALI